MKGLLAGALPPTLLTSTSRPPKRSAAPSTRRAAPAGVERSQATGSALPPAAVISWATALSASSPRAPMATAQPSAASLSAMARPIPLDAPVTAATLPRSSKSMVSLPARILRWSAARERVLVGLALVIVVSIGLRLPFLSVPLITDEGGYAYVAHWLTRGAALYRDLWFDRPQAIFVLYAAQMALLGESTEAIRFGAALYNAAAAVALYALGSALRSRAAGLMAAALFAVGSASPAIEGFTANGELYMGLPVALSLLCAVRGRWLAAGALCALAFAIKPTALATLVPPLALLVWQ